MLQDCNCDSLMVCTPFCDVFFQIPSIWTNTGEVDIGTWNLEAKLDEEEEHDLIH